MRNGPNIDIIIPEFDWEKTGPEACVRNPAW